MEGEAARTGTDGTASEKAKKTIGFRVEPPTIESALAHQGPKSRSSPTLRRLIRRGSQSSRAEPDLPANNQDSRHDDRQD